MAQVQYDPTSNVAPEQRAPDDYVRVQANPNAFGAGIAQGAEALGKGAMSAGQHWEEVQTDDMSNQAQKAGNDLVESFKTKYGQDALDAQGKTRQGLEDIYNSYKDKLSTSDQAVQFDKTNRPFFDRYLTGNLNTHANEQGLQFQLKTTNDAMEVANTMGATAGSTATEKDVGVAYTKALTAASKKLQITGQDRDPNAIAAAKDSAASVLKSYAEALSIKYPDKAMDFAERNKDRLGTLYEPLANSLSEKNDRVISAGASADALAKAKTSPMTMVAGAGDRVGGTNFANYSSKLAAGDVSGALRASEGLKTEPYWDVNHVRTGYGSDTVTRADGTVETVTPGTRITPADAERDLQRRTAQYAGNISTTIGADRWTSLSPGAQAALVSVAYNYGHLPSNVEAAARSGDNAALAAAVAAHAGDNNGANAARRRAEAAVISGTNAYATAPGATRAALGSQPQPFGQPTIPEQVSTTPTTSAPQSDLPIENAAATTTSDGGPTPQPEIAASPEDVFARQIQNIGENPNLSDRQRKMALEDARQNFTMAQVAAEQDVRAKREQKEAATNEVMKFVNDGDPQSALQHADQLRQTGKIDETEYATLSDVVKKRAGSDNPVTMGKGYDDIFKRMLLPANDPNRITDPMDIIRAEQQGDVTERGSNRLQENLARMKKDYKSFGDQMRVANLQKTLKEKLTYTNEANGLRDKEGTDIYEQQALPALLDQIDQWTAGGEPLSKMPILSDPKQMKAFVDQYRTDRDKEKARQAEINDILGGTRLPSAPDNADANYWSSLMQSPPISHGARAAPQDWARALNILVSNPTPDTVAAFNRRFGRGGYQGGQILKSLLGDKYTGPVEATPQPSYDSAAPYYNPG